MNLLSFRNWQPIFLTCLLAVTAKGENGETYLPGLDEEEILNFPPSDDDASLPPGKTMDDVLLEAQTPLGAQSQALASGGVIVEMDMIMTPRQYAARHSTPLAGGAVKSEYYRWPKRIIPYQISSSFSGNDKFIYSAMQEWMKRTCLVFTPAGSEKHREAGHNHKITIFSGQGCYSSVGYNHGDHRVSLSLRGCNHHGTALHELGHTIGLHHEQSRVDRDDALKIAYSNVPRRLKGNFDKQSDSSPLGVAYDFCSIMHYGNTAFSSNGKFTILTRNQDYQFTIGNPGSAGHRDALTFTDAKIVNMMYKCDAECPADAACKTPCYVNHKCQCECPEAEDKCPKKPCKDYYTDAAKCLMWKSSGRCHTGNTWMTRNCAETCGYCAEAIAVLGDDLIKGDGGPSGGGGGVTQPGGDVTQPGGGGAVTTTAAPVPVPTDAPAKGKLGPKCVDRQANCLAFVNFYRGDCWSDSSEFLRPMCPKSCNICLPCNDVDSKCKKWASLGYCYERGLNDQHLYMADNCKRACGYCV